MKIREVMDFMEKLAPGTYQEYYDNSGLILGSPDNEVTGILVCLDVDSKALDSAVEHGCQLIISHHPAVFKAIKSFTPDTREGLLLTRAVRNNLALYSSHTNFDSVVGGLADLLCQRLGIENIRILKKNLPGSESHGLGRWGEIAPASGEQFVSFIKNALALDSVRLVGEVPDIISRVAVYNGSYDSEILEELSKLRPDALVTGDLKYHDAQELMECRIFTIDAGHYGTEKIFVEELSAMLESEFGELNIVRFQGSDVFTCRM